MNVEIGAEAAQFPEKEYINGTELPLQCMDLLTIKTLLDSYPPFFLPIATTSNKKF
jgi:hypothetical protein